LSSNLSETARKIKLLREENPCLPAKRIAQIVGISPERTRQILLKLKLPTKFPKSREGFCFRCGKRLSYGQRKFCSRACYRAYHQIIVECSFL